jgi:hypothetical protein
MADRNRLAHGVPGDTADPRAVDEMAVLARDLISEKLATAG